MSLKRKISKWWFEYCFLRDARWITTYFGLKLEDTTIWKYLHSPYNPVASISPQEAYFEDIYLRHRDLTRHEIRQRIVIYLTRSQEIPEVPGQWPGLSPRKRSRFLKFMGFDGPLNCMRLTRPWTIPKDKWHFEEQGE